MSHSEQQNYANLIERVACGDQVAFQALFRGLGHDVFRLNYSLLLDHQMAEDAMQEAFVKLWQNAKKWRPEASVKTWLLTIARNHCLDVLRKKKSNLKKEHGLYQDQLALGAAVKKENAGRVLDEEKHRKTIQNALFLLPERQREAVTLVYYSEVRNSEAARIMGLQTAAFDSLLARARRSLRDRLGDEGNLLEGYFS